MEPLSIAAGSTALVVTCYKLISALYPLIDGTRNADSNVSALCDEITGLSKVLDGISKSWDRIPKPSLSEVDPDGTLWKSVSVSLEDCKSTLQKLDSVVQDIQKDGSGWSFIRKSMKSTRFNFKTKDIAQFRQQIQTHNSGMQSALQMINICLLISGQSSQGLTIRSLQGLQNSIDRVELVLQSQSPISPINASENTRVSNNMENLLRAARTFHSTAVTIASSSTVWGGSVIEEQLSEEQYHDIENWIPPPVTEQEQEDLMNEAFEARTFSEGTDETSQSGTAPSKEDEDKEDSDSDLDIEDELCKKLEELALAKLKLGDYSGAEVYFERIMNRRKAEPDTKGHLTEVRLNMATTYCFQNRWQEALDIVLPLTADKEAHNLNAFHILHSIAVKDMKEKHYDQAEKHCKTVLQGKKKILGRKHQSYFQSMALLDRIYLLQGNKIDAEACGRLYPDDIDFDEDPILCLSLAILGSKPSTTVNADVTSQPLAKEKKNVNQKERSLLDSANIKRPKLIFAIDIGCTFTCIKIGLITPDEQKEISLPHWPGVTEMSYGTESKFHSVIYYDEKGKIAGWGPTYDNALLPSGAPKPGIKKVYWFKFNLFPDYLHSQFIEWKKDIPESAGVDFLSKVQQLISSTVPEIPGSELNPEIWLYFLVPERTKLVSFLSAVGIAWPPEQSRGIRQHFIVQNEAAAHHCVKNGVYTPDIGDYVTVVHCGGAHTSIASYQVSSELFTHFVSRSRGIQDTCGSASLNKNFANLLEKRTGKMNLPGNTNDKQSVFGRCMIDFERRIKREFKNDGHAWAIDVMTEADYPEAGVEDGYMVWTNEEILEAFKPPVERIISLIVAEFANLKEMRALAQNLILVGGMAKSPYLLKEVENRFSGENIKVMRPNDAEFAASRGALAMAFDQALVEYEYSEADELDIL